jgi:hypothetical protein
MGRKAQGKKAWSDGFKRPAAPIGQRQRAGIVSGDDVVKLSSSTAFCDPEQQWQDRQPYARMRVPT